MFSRLRSPSDWFILALFTLVTLAFVGKVVDRDSVPDTRTAAQGQSAREAH